MLFRICLVMLKNYADAEDAVSETMLRYIEKKPVFKSDEHEKAWLIKVCKNKCMDILRQRKRTEAESEHKSTAFFTEKENDVYEALIGVPEKYRLVLTLYYIEGYSTEEIAGIIKRTPSAVKMRLKKGRELFKESYRKERF